MTEMFEQKKWEKASVDLWKSSSIFYQQRTVDITDMSRINTNKNQIPYDKHHKVFSLVKRHQNTQFC